MTRIALSFAIGLAAISAATTAPALADEPVGTIQRGNYVCELPGDAGTAAGIVQDDESFRIESASRYTAAQGDGTYLRRGNMVMFTSGPRNGDRYRIVRRGYLRKLVDGEPSRLRCVRQAR